MSVPDAAPVVIACPNCGTRYQVDYSAIGRRGRSVQCAHCGKSWQAHAEKPHAPARPKPEPEAAVIDLPRAARPVPEDKPLNELAEEMLDLKFLEEEKKARARRDAARAKPHGADVIADLPPAATAADPDDAARMLFLARDKTRKAGAPPAGEAAPVEGAHLRDPGYQRTVDEIKAAIAPRARAAAALPADPAATARRLQHAFSERQRLLASRLPIARFRRAARIVALLALVGVLAGGYYGRTQLVQAFPELAGLYAALGLGINVVGLEFRNVRTLQSLQQGLEVLEVDGTIASVAAQPVAVPQVVVTLIDKAGAPLYEWSLVPKATMLAPGESVALDTQLSKPPAGAVSVRLAFASGGTGTRQLDAPGNDGQPGSPPVAVVLGGAPGGSEHRPR